jgi:hypothetical protein
MKERATNDSRADRFPIGSLVQWQASDGRFIALVIGTTPKRVIVQYLTEQMTVEEYEVQPGVARVRPQNLTIHHEVVGLAGGAAYAEHAADMEAHKDARGNLRLTPVMVAEAGQRHALIWLTALGYPAAAFTSVAPVPHLQEAYEVFRAVYKAAYGRRWQHWEHVLQAR